MSKPFKVPFNLQQLVNACVICKDMEWDKEERRNRCEDCIVSRFIIIINEIINDRFVQAQVDLGKEEKK